MAKLISCECCSKQISDEAVNCVHCGQPNVYAMHPLQAVYYIQKQRGCSLHEAKEIVEKLGLEKNIKR